MPSVPLRRAGLSMLVWALIFTALIAFISFAARQQQAAGSLSLPTSNHFSLGRAVVADRGGLTPAATMTINSLTDVANGTDGLCTLREAITAANTNTASGPAAGECAAGDSTGADQIVASGITGTINLTGALPNITSSMTISGPG